MAFLLFTQALIFHIFALLELPRHPVPMNFITDPTYDKMPDYSSAEYDEPKYDSASPAKNLLDYKKWRALWAMRHFLDAADNATELNVVELLYHPLFPKAFIKKVCGYSKGKPSIPLYAVESYLEGKYGEQLQQPDCDYLIDILSDKVSGIKNTQNGQRALRWIIAKKQQLSPWPFFQEDKSSISDAVNSDSEARADELNINTVDEPHNRVDSPAEFNDSTSEKDTRIASIDKKHTGVATHTESSYAKPDSIKDGLFLKTNFDWVEVDLLAEELGIISKGKYCLGDRKKAAVAGFLDALKTYQIIAKKTQPELYSEFGKRYSVVVNTDREGKTIRPVFRNRTADALEKRGFKKPEVID